MATYGGESKKKTKDTGVTSDKKLKDIRKVYVGASYEQDADVLQELDLKGVGRSLKRGLKKVFSGPVMKPNVNKQQHFDKIRASGGNPGGGLKLDSFEPEGEMVEAKVDAKTPDYKRATVRDKRYGNPHGSHELGGGIRKDRRADHAERRGKKTKGMKEETLKEKMSSYDRNRKAAAKRAAARNAARDAGKTGVVPGVGYVTPRRENETYRDEAGVHRHKSGAKMPSKKKEEQKEGTSYGIYKGDGKPKGAMAMFAKKKKEKKEVKEDMKGMSQKSGDKRSTESGAGMTAKGVAKYNRRTGGDLKTAVTTPPSKLKAGSKAAGRRKSFCARSKSWDGPRGKAARRRWNCEFTPDLPMLPEEKKKDTALDIVKKGIIAKYGKKAIMRKGSNQPKKVRGAKSTAGTGKYKDMADRKKQTASDAKKRGFKDSKSYIETMARHGGKKNYDSGRGLGS